MTWAQLQVYMNTYTSLQSLSFITDVQVPLKMATDIKYPRTHGYPTRWARIRFWVCARGRGRGYDSKPNGYFITGLKI